MSEHAIFIDDDYYDEDDFMEDDQFEDQKAMESLKVHLKIPDEWYLIKIVSFTRHKLEQIDQYLKETCSHPYRRVNWSSGCSTSIGVAIQDLDEAILFKLRFS